MRVLKVVAEGITTSFRYPHFMQGIHPTFQMPPPATIYGHICSALGEWFDPSGVQFAYHFTHQGRARNRDLEHIILLTPSTGYLPDTRIPKVLEGNVNPFERDLLFQPRLTLYINRPEWEAAFRSPRYAVTLGRSQDLFTYTFVGVVELIQAEHAYFEHTLVPHEMALRIQRGVTVLMPRYLDYTRNRAPAFSRYVVISDRVFSDEFYNIRDIPVFLVPDRDQISRQIHDRNRCGCSR
ncbi:MAG: CRISPR-associated protein Cas5, partial [Thermanaerothrix sp.]|nr:CRISPR-associated protein Cas5 [Thermanaerothrix sp.]